MQRRTDDEPRLERSDILIVTNLEDNVTNLGNNYDWIKHSLERSPTEYALVPIVDRKQLEQMMERGVEIKKVVIDVRTDNWRQLVEQLSSKGVKVGVLSVLPSLTNVLGAYNNGAKAFGHDPVEVLYILAGEAGR